MLSLNYSRIQKSAVEKADLYGVAEITRKCISPAIYPPGKDTLADLLCRYVAKKVSGKDLFRRADTWDASGRKPSC